MNPREAFGDFLRQARRDADLSQRQLARYSGIPRATVAAVESGARDPSLCRARTLLETCGYQLVVLDRHGAILEEVRPDWRRDRGGRRFPAHLDVRHWPIYPGRAGGHKVQPDDRQHTFDLNRGFRDWKRDCRAAERHRNQRLEDP